MKTIAIIAGEASGDLYGAHLIRALQAQIDPVFICGMGGNAMRAAGAHLVVDANQLSVMGITEALFQARIIWQARTRIKALLMGLRPDLLILIDFPGFNLHLAGIAKALGIKVLYYISPKIWAWRSKRVNKIKARVDHMAIILPFEQAFYNQHDVPTTFVGHPLMDTIMSQPAAPPRSLPSQGQPLTVGLLPGSRRHEVTDLLPRMLQAGALLRDKWKNEIRFLVSCAPSIDEKMIANIVSQYRLPNVNIVADRAGILFPQCHLAIVASGTVTLEAAIYGAPMVITYGVSRLSYLLGKALIRVDHIGLVNLIAEKRIAPELIQHQATPAALAQAAFELISTPENYSQACKELQTVKQRLGEPGASQRAARIACAIIEGRTP